MFLLPFHMIGLSRETADTEQIGRLGATPESLQQLLERARAAGAASVALGTCNRVELYWWGDADLAPDFQAWAASRNSGGLIPPIEECDADRAVRHLFAVASGLRSQRVGEAAGVGASGHRGGGLRGRRRLCGARAVGRAPRVHHGHEPHRLSRDAPRRVDAASRSAVHTHTGRAVEQRGPDARAKRCRDIRDAGHGPAGGCGARECTAAATDPRLPLVGLRRAAKRGTGGPSRTGPRSRWSPASTALPRRSLAAHRTAGQRRDL